jgi:hypothetical protein
MTIIDNEDVDNNFSIHQDSSNNPCDTVIFYLHCSDDL